MTVTPEKRRRIKKESGFRCGFPNCGERTPLEIHHITPQAEGGSDDLENLICLCRNCHGLVTDGIIDQRSVQEAKEQLVMQNMNLHLHHYKILESLLQGDLVELSPDDVHLALKLERKGLITIQEMKRPPMFRLWITRRGREFIE